MGQKKILSINVLSGLEVSGMDTNDFIEPSNVLTQKITPVSKLNIPRQEDVAKSSHLGNINLHDIVDSNV